ncbi:MAG: segregation and condensation protein A [Erysipelotrichaceae bacterium]|nr:MAG: segregation and condensation protein [Erysipelotrichaceae bacterium]TXT17362.1 MAG: segregation and condensation protein A [Erysipelotrichaceae bacterium]
MVRFQVDLDQFEGPLDLMLHLIKEKKLDLFNLEVDVLIDQYIDFIHGLETTQLEIASEYLVELATLIEYKSKKCLPVSDLGLDVADYEKDTKDELVRRLIEYQKFKDITQKLQVRFEERQLQMDKPSDSLYLNEIDDQYHYYESDVYELIKAMEKCIARFHLSHPSQVQFTKNEISLEDRMDQLYHMISADQMLYDFEDFIKDIGSLNLFIVSFLAILELVRQGILGIESVSDQKITLKLGEKYGKPE